MSSTRLGVAILGGGIAGNLLARQLKRTLPAVQVGLFEKSTEDGYKVGESMVEIATNYFVRKLGLSSYLYERHLPKNGLRFFFDTPEHDAPLDAMSEIGSESLPYHPAFQIDRARLDGDLAGMNAADGVLVRRGVRVRDIQLGSQGEPHRFIGVDEDGTATHYEAPWLVDASGRSRVLGKLLHFHEPETELTNASVWGRFEGVTDIDDMGPESFHARVRYSARRLSTVHFLYPGYWIWFIPLRDGVTSVGVVCDKEIFTPQLKTQDGFRAFLDRHRAVASLLENAKPVDQVCYLKLAYQTTRFFSAERWGVTGEAGCFTDPFYSPGSDFIALENDLLTDLISRDFDGASTEELAERAELYEEFMRFRQEATFELYRGQYSLFGSSTAVKLKWNFDIGSYYHLWVDAYMRDLHLDEGWLRSQLAQRPYVMRALANFRELFATVESRLREDDRYYEGNLGGYNDGRDCLGYLSEIGTPQTEAQTLARLGEVFNRVRNDALATLGEPVPDEPLPLPLFMGRKPLI